MSSSPVTNPFPFFSVHAVILLLTSKSKWCRRNHSGSLHLINSVEQSTYWEADRCLSIPKLPVLYLNWRLITISTRARQSPLFWLTWAQFTITPPPANCLRSILIQSWHLRHPGLSSDRFISGFLTRLLHALLISSVCASCFAPHWFYNPLHFFLHSDRWETNSLCPSKQLVWF
jgi:hypothetical protein